MAFGWIFNAPAYLALEPILGPVGTRGLLGASFIGVGVVLFLRAGRGEGDSDVRALPGEYLFSAMLIALPVLNPWYVVWPLAYWMRRPSGWLAMASLVVLASYAGGLNLGWSGLEPYELPVFVVVADVGFVAAAGIWDLRRRWSLQSLEIELEPPVGVVN
jgi:hypothetical protein